MQDHEASDQSQRAFCAERGIGQSSLRYWKRRLEKTSERASVAVGQWPRLLPVDLIDEHTALAAGSGVTILTGGGTHIGVKRHFDAGVLRRVAAALEAKG